MGALDELMPRYIELVEESMRRLLPVRVTEDYLWELTGMKGFDVEALNASLSTPAWDLLSRGGKRWRPVMTMMVYEALGGSAEEVADLAAVTELVHNGTLAVDDVEDRSELRRGKPCVHILYGEDVAINMGNALYYLPLLAAIRRGSVPERLIGRVLTVYLEEMTNLSLGQSLDIAWHRSLSEQVDEERYMTMCKLKTGSLVRMGIRFACALREVDSEVERRLVGFGDAISVAFQIQDDVLNLVGSEEEYGKEIGGDIKEGKRTLMVVHALRTLPGEKSRRLLEILRMQTSDRELIREAIRLIAEAGSIEYSKRVARELVERAWAEVDGVLPESRQKEGLRELARFLVERSR
ncbi:MAG: polyprenyl synthetase family protein [Nitrososphaerota archaeon]